MGRRYQVSQDPDELYEGERVELQEFLAKPSPWSWGMWLLLLGNCVACGCVFGFSNFRLGLGPDVWAQHAGSIVVVGIGFVGRKLLHIPAFGVVEGIGLWLFTCELFGAVGAVIH